MRFFIYTLSLLFLLQTYSVSANQQKVKLKTRLQVKRNIAQALSQDLSYVTLNYNVKSAPSPIQNFKLYFSPFANFISFEVAQKKYVDESGQNKTVIMDCFPAEKNTKWDCLSGCQGGSMQLSFYQDTRMDNLQIAPFKIKARSCDGTESDKDPLLTTKQPLVLIFKD